MSLGLILSGSVELANNNWPKDVQTKKLGLSLLLYQIENRVVDIQ